MNKKNFFESSLVVLILLLVAIAGYSTLSLINMNNQQTSENISETSVKLDEYKYYKFDNLSFGFIIADIDISQNADKINLESLKTSEGFSFSTFGDQIDTMRQVGYKVDQLSLVNKLIVGKNKIFIVVNEPDKTKELSVKFNEQNVLKFDLSNALSDKSVFGFENKTSDDPVGTESPTETQNDEKANESDSKPINVKPNSKLEIKKLHEVNPENVLISNGSKYSPVGYPSNIRVFVVPVSIKDSQVSFNSATLSFNGVSQTFKAIKGDIKIAESNQVNLIGNQKAKEGVLIFELNSGEFDVESLTYNLDYELYGEK